MVDIEKANATVVEKFMEARPVATTMAGRGTDIKLGPGVAELGGLAVLGVAKMSSRRIDDQLRGRAGPGFFDWG